MTTALYIIGYIILMLFTAWALHHWGDIRDKEDALGLGAIWPFVWSFLLVCLLLWPVWFIGQLLIKLWDKLEN